MPVVDGRYFATEELAEEWVKDWELVYGERLDIDEDLPKGRLFSKAIYGSEIMVNNDGSIASYSACWLWPETLGLVKAGEAYWAFRSTESYQVKAEREFKKSWAERKVT